MKLSDISAAIREMIDQERWAWKKRLIAFLEEEEGEYYRQIGGDPTITEIKFDVLQAKADAIRRVIDKLEEQA